MEDEDDVPRDENGWRTDGMAGGLRRRLMDPQERMKHGWQSRWTRRPDGTYAPPEIIERFLEEWCLMPRSQRVSQAEWSRLNGVSPRTVAGWKQDERFHKEWKRRLHYSWEDPDRLDEIITSIADAATQGGPQAMQAAKLYLQFLGLVQPPELKMSVTAVPSDLERLDDAELLELYREETRGELPA